MKVTAHVSHDWCHICGERSEFNADVSYPENAEHGGPDSKYIRICHDCGLRIASASIRPAILEYLNRPEPTP